MQRFIFPALILSLSACGQAGNYPSLNPRPIESKAAGLLTEPEPEATPLAPATEAVREKVDAAMNVAKAGAADFDRTLPSVSAAARNAGASGSESWIAAQMAISALERTRAPVKVALSDLDGLLRATLGGTPSEDIAIVEGAIRDIEAIDIRQNEAMADLLRSVSR